MSVLSACKTKRAKPPTAVGQQDELSAISNAPSNFSADLVEVFIYPNAIILVEDDASFSLSANWFKGWYTPKPKAVSKANEAPRSRLDDPFKKVDVDESKYPQFTLEELVPDKLSLPRFFEIGLADGSLQKSIATARSIADGEKLIRVPDIGTQRVFQVKPEKVKEFFDQIAAIDERPRFVLLNSGDFKQIMEKWANHIELEKVKVNKEQSHLLPFMALKRKIDEDSLIDKDTFSIKPARSGESYLVIEKHSIELEDGWKLQNNEFSRRENGTADDGSAFDFEDTLGAKGFEVNTYINKGQKNSQKISYTMKFAREKDPGTIRQEIKQGDDYFEQQSDFTNLDSMLFRVEPGIEVNLKKSIDANNEVRYQLDYSRNDATEGFLTGFDFIPPESTSSSFLSPSNARKIHQRMIEEIEILRSEL